MHPLLKPFREAVRPIKRAYVASKRQKFYPSRPIAYSEDGLYSSHICDFVSDPQFDPAYKRGMQAVGRDYNFRWRVHTALWAARQAMRLEGDFVECGVNKGFLSSAVMHYLNWNSLNRDFYLMDTFCGLDEKELNERELAAGLMEKSKQQYPDCYAEAQANFREFKNVIFVKGTIPKTLKEVTTPKIAYLSIDMNCAGPEIAAIEYFWPKLVLGAVVVLDDYAYDSHGSTREQKRAFDQFTDKFGISVLSLPTGQGMIIKPGS